MFTNQNMPPEFAFRVRREQEADALTNRETTLSHDLYNHIFETLDDEPGIVTTQEAGRIATELQERFISLLIENR